MEIKNVQKGKKVRLLDDASIYHGGNGRLPKNEVVIVIQQYPNNHFTVVAYDSNARTGFTINEDTLVEKV